MRFNFLRRRKAQTIDEIEERSRRNAGLSFGFLTYGSSGMLKQDKAMLLPAVYRCVELITDSVAQLPLDPYRMDSRGFRTKATDDPRAHLLNCEPNARMTRYVFIKTLVASMLLDGNGYAYIQRDASGMPVALHFIPSEYVTIVLPNNISKPPTYTVATVTGIPASDMIHVLNFSYDGVQGVSTLRHAIGSIGLANAAESHASGFFKGGCNVGGILKVMSALSDKQKRELEGAWAGAFNTESGAPNGVAVLDGNMEYSPVSVSPRDSMLLETRQYTVIDICRFFGVSPTKCYDLSKSNYNTLEQSNLSFLTDTLSPILRKIELEFERKLFPQGEHSGIEVRFDTRQFLQGDKTAQAQYFSTLFSLGSISPNEIRREADLPPVDGGDSLFVQVNMQTLQAAARNNGEKSEKTEDKNPQ